MDQALFKVKLTFLLEHIIKWWLLIRVHICFLSLSVVWLPLLGNNHRAHSLRNVRESSSTGRERPVASVVSRLGSDWSNCAVNLAHFRDFGF